MIDLYTAATPNGHKISIALEELGLPYELRTLQLAEQEQKQPWFLRINPNGRIPAIVDRAADDFVVFESGAILIYLAEKTGRLLPGSPKERSRVLQWLMFQVSGVGPMMGQAKVFGHLFPERIPAVIDRYQNESRRLLGVLDQHLARHEFLADDYSIADIATWPWVRKHLWSGVSLDELPHLTRWMDTIGARPAVQRGIERPSATLTVNPVVKLAQAEPLPAARDDAAAAPPPVVPVIRQVIEVAAEPPAPAPAPAPTAAPASTPAAAPAPSPAPAPAPAQATVRPAMPRPVGPSAPPALHHVRDLVMVTLAATLTGLTDWPSIADFAQENADWMKGRLISLPAGLPTQTVFTQVIGRMDPVAFAHALGAWNLAGRPLKGRAGSPLMTASADERQWALDATADASGDIDELIALLDLKGALVSVHACGSEPAIADAIQRQGGHYILALRDDPMRPALLEDVRQWLNYCDAVHSGQVADHTTLLPGHTASVQVVVSSDIDWLVDKPDWPALQAVARLTTTHIAGGQPVTEHQHVLCSMAEPRRILEMALPGGLLPGRLVDIQFPDRTDLANGMTNLATVRRLALQILGQDTVHPDLNVRRRMMRAQSDPVYLQTLLRS